METRVNNPLAGVPVSSRDPRPAPRRLEVPTDEDMAELVRSEYRARRFVHEDITTEIAAFAHWYVSRYDGNFEFLLSVQEQVARRGDISIGQAKGVMNCYRADVLKRKVIGKDGVARPQTPITEGFWTLDGVVYKVQVAHHGSGNLYGKKLDVNTGKFNYVSGVVQLLAREGAEPLTLEKAKEMGHLYGRCMICGATLTKEESIERGIGPVCAGRL